MMHRRIRVIGRSIALLVWLIVLQARAEGDALPAERYRGRAGVGGCSAFGVERWMLNVER
jgi:hypothetical protein